MSNGLTVTHRTQSAKRTRRMPYRPSRLILAVFAAATSAVAQPSGGACGSLANAFGPFDYRYVRGHELQIVEGAHFTPTVEELIRGNRGNLGSDLDYTLRAFPNHHRALVSMIRYGERTKSPQPPNTRYPVECYLERAIRFQRDDVIARLLYATFLQKAGRHDEANAQLEQAEGFAGDSAFTHYNIGLVYLDGKNYQGAVRQAHRAYELGFPRTELKDRLIAAGKWKDPPASAADSRTPQGAQPASAPRP